jgi:hypothetical protein
MRAVDRAALRRSGRQSIRPNTLYGVGAFVFRERENMNIWLLLAVIAWIIGALEPLLGGPSKVNWLCAGLCLAGIGVWLV